MGFKFKTLEAFAMHIAGVEHEMHAVAQDIVEVAAAVVEHEVKSGIGTYKWGWPALASETLARKAADTPLQETGQFKASIGRSIGHLEAYVGTNDPRGKYFEFGTSRMPPRPFLLPAAIAAEKPVEEYARAQVAHVLEGEHMIKHALHFLKHAFGELKEIYEDLGEDPEEERRRGR